MICWKNQESWQLSECYLGMKTHKLPRSKSDQACVENTEDLTHNQVDQKAPMFMTWWVRAVLVAQWGPYSIGQVDLCIW